MSKTVAELNQIASEIANKIGYISQELLLEIHALVHKDAPASAAPAAAPVAAAPAAAPEAPAANA